jgi:hypothetical protein
VFFTALFLTLDSVSGQDVPFIEFGGQGTYDDPYYYHYRHHGEGWRARRGQTIKQSSSPGTPFVEDEPHEIPWNKLEEKKIDFSSDVENGFYVNRKGEKHEFSTHNSFYHYGDIETTIEILFIFLKVEPQPGVNDKVEERSSICEAIRRVTPGLPPERASIKLFTTHQDVLAPIPANGEFRLFGISEQNSVLKARGGRSLSRDS